MIITPETLDTELAQARADRARLDRVIAWLEEGKTVLHGHEPTAPTEPEGGGGIQ